MKKTVIFAILILAACGPRNVIPPTNQIPTTPIQTSNITATPIILFAEDSADLTSSAKSQLVSAASLLSKTAQSIRIIGHADAEGSREYNLGLGAQRAAAVRDILVANGVANTRISISTVGNENPAQNCESAACKAQNRRVVIIAG